MRVFFKIIDIKINTIIPYPHHFKFSKVRVLKPQGRYLNRQFPLPPAMSHSVEQQLSLFRSLIQTRRSSPSLSLSLSLPFPVANISVSFLAVSATPRSDFCNRFWSPRTWNRCSKFDPAWRNSSNLNLSPLFARPPRKPSTRSFSFSNSSSALSLSSEIYRYFYCFQVSRSSIKHSHITFLVDFICSNLT